MSSHPEVAEAGDAEPQGACTLSTQASTCYTLRTATLAERSSHVKH